MKPGGSLMPTSGSQLRIFVPTPWTPRAAMKMKARMTPPMLAATPGERHDHRAQPARALQPHDDEGEQGADQPADDRRQRRQLQRLDEVVLELARRSPRASPARSEPSVCCEGLAEDRDRRHDQEQAEEGEERDQPGPRRDS